MSVISTRVIFGAATMTGALLLSSLPAQADELMWIDHLGFLAGDPSVDVSFNAVNSGVGGGLAGLIIESSTTGEEAEGGGNKVVETGLLVPPGYLVEGVRVCYELSSATSFISQIRLAQVQGPSSTAIVMLDDATDLADADRAARSRAAARGGSGIRTGDPHPRIPDRQGHGSQQ